MLRHLHNPPLAREHVLPSQFSVLAEIVPRRCFALEALERQRRTARELQRVTPEIMLAHHRASIEEMFFRPIDCRRRRNRLRFTRSGGHIQRRLICGRELALPQRPKPLVRQVAHFA